MTETLAGAGDGVQIVLPTLLRRIPALRSAVPVDELPVKHDALAYGLDELPVEW